MKKTTAMVIKASSATRNGNVSSIIQDLAKAPMDEVIKIKDIYDELQTTGYLVKPMRKKVAEVIGVASESEVTPELAYTTLGDGAHDQLRVEALLLGFFENLGKTGDYCYYKKSVFLYSDEEEDFYLLKGQQVNLLGFVSILKNPYTYHVKSYFNL